MGEREYLELLGTILRDGDIRRDRTGTGTRSIFGGSLSFDMREGFPLLTTKRVFWRGILEELLWFIRGNTDSKTLEDRGVNIWALNTSRQFLDSNGFTERDVGDIGPTYGFQWRHYNAEYRGPDYDYKGCGIDQLQRVVDQIREDPWSRRIVMTAWNPSQLHDMTLAPCHILCQFYVHVETSELSIQMYQRSADMFLGVPFNIGSYALLLHIVAKITGLTPRMLHMRFGDCHVYSNHIEVATEQCTRAPHTLPTLKISDTVTSLDSLDPSAFVISGYVHHPPLIAPMAV